MLSSFGLEHLFGWNVYSVLDHYRWLNHCTMVRRASESQRKHRVLIGYFMLFVCPPWQPHRGTLVATRRLR